MQPGSGRAVLRGVAARWFALVARAARCLDGTYLGWDCALPVGFGWRILRGTPLLLFVRAHGP